jgi:hypothetical protein
MELSDSNRRLIVTVAACLAAGLSARLGISEALAFGILGLAGTYLGLGNLKAIMLGKAEIAAAAPAAPPEVSP